MLDKINEIMGRFTMWVVMSAFFAFAVVVFVGLFIVAYYGFNRLGDFLGRVIGY